MVVCLVQGISSCLDPAAPLWLHQEEMSFQKKCPFLSGEGRVEPHTANTLQALQWVQMADPDGEGGVGVQVTLQSSPVPLKAARLLGMQPVIHCLKSG